MFGVEQLLHSWIFRIFLSSSPFTFETFYSSRLFFVCVKILTMRSSIWNRPNIIVGEVKTISSEKLFVCFSFIRSFIETENKGKAPLSLFHSLFILPLVSPCTTSMLLYCLNKRRAQCHRVISPEPHPLNLGIHGHFKREEHVLALVTQSQAPKPIHAPHEQILVTGHGSHMEQSRVNRRHSTTWIKVVPSEQGGRQLLWHPQLANFWPEAQHTVSPGEHITRLCRGEISWHGLNIKWFILSRTFCFRIRAKHNLWTAIRILLLCECQLKVCLLSCFCFLSRMHRRLLRFICDSHNLSFLIILTIKCHAEWATSCDVHDASVFLCAE